MSLVNIFRVIFFHSFPTFRPSSAPLQSILIHSSGNVKSTLFSDGWLAQFVRRRAKKMQISRCWVKRRIEWKLHWSTWESLALSEQWGPKTKKESKKQENRKSFLIHNCTLCEQLEKLDMRTWRNSSRLEIIVRAEICWIFPHIRSTFIVFSSSTCIFSNRKLWLLQDIFALRSVTRTAL